MKRLPIDDGDGAKGSEPEPSHEIRGVLFADLADSSRLYRELGDLRARELSQQALGVARHAVESWGGRVVDQIGDELFCVLPDGLAAYRGALAVQEQVDRLREDGVLSVEVAFRIGFVQGAVGLRGDEVFGDAVYLANRIAGVAKADQVLTDRETARSVHSSVGMEFHALGPVRLKGRIEEVELFEALWGDSVTQPVPAERTLRQEPEGVLTLHHDGEDIVVSREQPAVTLGRSATCEVSVDDSLVSRRHARIELQAVGFLLVDQSRNGTLVRRGERPERLVLRASEPLRGSGTLQLGPHENAPVIEYSVRLRD